MHTLAHFLSGLIRKCYGEDLLRADVTRAVTAYRQDVEARNFPGPEQSYSMADQEWESFRAGAGGRRPRPVGARARWPTAARAW